jgi:hypothetical protein
MNILQDELDSVTLKPGDIIIDHLAGYVGILLRRERRIDMVLDDLYFWEIRWASSFRPTSTKRNRKTKPLDIGGYLEEDVLKLSILVGAIELHSSSENKND